MMGFGNLSTEKVINGTGLTGIIFGMA